MERKNRAEYLALRESGKSLQEIADMYGVSKQRVHEVLSEKSRTHKRTELRQQVKDLQTENQRLRNINAELRTALEDIARDYDPKQTWITVAVERRLIARRALDSLLGKNDGR